MKYLYCLVFSLLPGFCPAQLVCKVYQHPAGLPAEKELVLTRVCDEKNRPLREEVRGYNLFLNNTNTMYCHREDGIYEYYYDDTIHYKTVFTVLDDISRKPIDSGKIFYYYDDSTGRLVKDVDVKHLCKRIPGKKPGSIRNTVVYSYDSAGRLIMKSGTYTSNCAEYMSYDSQNRLLTDSVRQTCAVEDFCLVTKYEYTDDGYREYAWMCDKKHPMITIYRLDNEKRIIEQATWFHINDETSGGKKLSVPDNWGAYLNNDLKKYQQYEKTETTYDAAGRIAETRYYFGGKHTTTHTFVYETLAATKG
jgi:hypothetical protein